MKIIKHGDLSRLIKTRQFTCGDCGCIWEASQTEYRPEYDHANTIYLCECPTCGRLSYDSVSVSELTQEKSPL